MHIWPVLRVRSVSGRRGDPPHARLGRGHQGDYPQVRPPRLCGHLPNLHYREGKSTPEENSASVRAAGGMPDDRTMGDVAGAIAYLHTLPYLNGKVGIIGYCSGGRQVYLAACTLRGIDAAIDCYGGGVIATPDGTHRASTRGPDRIYPGFAVSLARPLWPGGSAPVAGGRGKNRRGTQKVGQTYEFHMYDNAGHGFFSVDRPSYRQEAAVDGWEKAFHWFGRHLR